MEITGLHSSVFDTLSRRQYQVMLLIISGNTDKEISERLGISDETVRTHHREINRKIGVHSVKELMHLAIHHGLIAAKKIEV